MQKVRVPINSFQYGEISDSLLMRTDSPVYAQSAQRLENLIVMGEGAVKKRTGLKHIYDYSLTGSSSDNQSHLFKFVFDDNEEYVISVENAKVRCFRLLTDGTVSLVTTITSDVDGGALPFDDDYLQEYTAAQYGDVMFISHPLFAPRMLVRTSLTNFEVETYSFDTRGDTSLLTDTAGTVDDDGITLLKTNADGSITSFPFDGALVSSGAARFGDEARRITVYLNNNSAPGNGMPFTINITIIGTNINGGFQNEIIPTNQGQSVLTYTSTNYFKTVTVIEVSQQIANFSLKAGISADRRFYQPIVTYQPYTKFHGSGVTLNPSAVSGTGITLTTSTNYWTSDHVGTIVRYHKSEILITGYTSATVVTGNVTDSLAARLTVVNPLRTRDGSNVVEVTHINHGLKNGDAITVQNAAATGGINTGNLNVTDQVRSVIDDNTYTYQAGGNASSSEDGGGIVTISCHAPTTEWDEQSFSAVRGYPAAVVFHENRLCFGGTLAEPDTIWMSKLGSFFNFDVGTAADDESINLVAATGDSHEIRYMTSNRDLQVFTSTGELYVPTYLNQAITPTNAQIRMQTPYGTEFVAPASIDGATIFVQKNGRIIREYLYSDSEDAYTASAISTLASHLVESPKYLSVAHSGFGLPDSYAAFSLNNGDLILFSSNRAERRASWTRATTAGGFGSVIALHDRLFANVYDSDGKLHLCEFDSNIGLDFYIYKAYGTGSVNVSSVFANGSVVDVIEADSNTYLGEFTVSAGVINLTAHSAFANFYIGKKFTAKLVTNPIDASIGNGPSTGTTRGITNIIVDVKSTESMKVNSNDVIASSFTGKKEVKTLGYNRNPQVTIEQDKPLGLQINGIVAELIV